MRGARRTDGTQVHLLAAMTGIGLVTAQREVEGKTNEFTVFQLLLGGLAMTGTVVTFDALHSQTAPAGRQGRGRCAYNSSRIPSGGIRGRRSRRMGTSLAGDRDR